MYILFTFAAFKMQLMNQNLRRISGKPSLESRPKLSHSDNMFFFSLNSFSEKVLKICYSSFMVTGVILNLAIIVIFLSKEVSTIIQTLIKKWKIISCLSQVMLTTQNILILNLCAANLLMIFFNIPLTISDITEIYWTLESVLIII